MYFTSILSTSDFRRSIDCRNSLTSSLAFETKDCIKIQCQSNNTGSYYDAPPHALLILSNEKYTANKSSNIAIVMASWPSH